MESPDSAEYLARVLSGASLASRRIAVVGHNSKRLMGGPVVDGEVVISTARLNRVLQYEPNDLTVSVEAGLPWGELQSMLASHGQMIALDPPFAAQATVGGIVASNSNGPLRKHFGTARDLVIGMQFAMLDGKLIRTGGMVVKNVAGLDMGKLMIGSFGTLAVITSVNFRLHSLPAEKNTFLFSCKDLAGAIERRDALLRSYLRPLAIDCWTPEAAMSVGQQGFVLAVRAGGTKQVLARYARELSEAARLTGAAEAVLWEQIREFPQEFLRKRPEGVVLRISTAIGDVERVLQLVSGAAISRAASGVTYIYLNSATLVLPLWQAALANGWAATIEYAPDEVRRTQALLLPSKTQSEAGFAMMKSIKHMFDPSNLLNPLRLYGRI